MDVSEIKKFAKDGYNADNIVPFSEFFSIYIASGDTVVFERDHSFYRSINVFSGAQSAVVFEFKFNGAYAKIIESISSFDSDGFFGSSYRITNTSTATILVHVQIVGYRLL
jgi:hypothetical protein